MTDDNVIDLRPRMARWYVEVTYEDRTVEHFGPRTTKFRATALADLYRTYPNVQKVEVLAWP